jgi:hypothetical protein
MVNVTTDDVRRRLKIPEGDIEDPDVMEFIEDAAAWISDQISGEIDPKDCTKSERNAIANLAAIYCYCSITGISSTGWTANLGSLSFSGPSEKIAQLEFLKKQVADFIAKRQETEDDEDDDDVPFLVGHG